MTCIIHSEIDQHLAQEEEGENYEALLLECTQDLAAGDVITCNVIDYSYQADVLDNLAINDEFCAALALIHSDKETAVELIENLASDQLTKVVRELADEIIESRAMDAAENAAENGDH